MMQLRKANERGHIDMGWLDTYHTFSFGEYYDPRFMGYRKLRVINHDFIAANTGFPKHGHRNMEIITYVVHGAVEHQDSLGNKAQIKANEVQVMTAGKGILHSEANPSSNEKLELLQIWIEPEANSIEPSYHQKKFSEEMKLNKLCLLASRTGSEGSLVIHQDVNLYASILEPNQKLEFAGKADRGQWIQIVSGHLNVNDQALKTGDGLAIEKENQLAISAIEKTNFLLFDLA